MPGAGRINSWSDRRIRIERVADWTAVAQRAGAERPDHHVVALATEETMNGIADFDVGEVTVTVEPSRSIHSVGLTVDDN